MYLEKIKSNNIAQRNKIQNLSGYNISRFYQNLGINPGKCDILENFGTVNFLLTFIRPVIIHEKDFEYNSRKWKIIVSRAPCSS